MRIFLGLIGLLVVVSCAPRVIVEKSYRPQTSSNDTLFVYVTSNYQMHYDPRTCNELDNIKGKDQREKMINWIYENMPEKIAQTSCFTKIMIDTMDYRLCRETRLPYREQVRNVHFTKDDNTMDKYITVDSSEYRMVSSKNPDNRKYMILDSLTISAITAVNVAMIGFVPVAAIPSRSLQFMAKMVLNEGGAPIMYGRLLASSNSSYHISIDSWYDLLDRVVKQCFHNSPFYKASEKAY
jgi:hypothetical protein